MAPPILTLRDVRLTFGGNPVLDGAELSVSAGDRLCLVGRNGSGKSTLLKVAAGLIEPHDGEIFRQPGTTIRYLPQEPDLTGFESTQAYVEAGLAPGDDDYRASYVLQQLGLSGMERPETLSGGEQRRAALARVLAPEPDILLLDEPTNHLDLRAIEWLENELKTMRSALVLISHDRRFLENLSRASIWLYQGTTRRLDRGFEAFEEWRDGIFTNLEKDRDSLDKKIAVETEWLHKGVTARRTRNQGRLRALHDLRRQRRDMRQATGNVVLTAADSELSGKMVIDAKGITKAYDDNPPVVEEFSLRVLRGDRIGIVGPNGAGKTTLINVLTGELAPDAGQVRIGVNLEIVTLDQKRESLLPDTRLADALTGGQGDSVMVGGSLRHVIGYMKDFLFTPNQARTPLSALSGGERGRLMLARALARPANLLILDEPTNDLDLETLDLLQEMLADFSGTVILVSHDRDFLDRTVNATIAWDGEGRWIEYAGGYSDMIVQRGRGFGDAVPKSRNSKVQTKSVAPQSSTPAQKGKLSFKDKHALDVLPGRIESLRGKIAVLNSRLADPELFKRDLDGFQKTVTDLQRTEAELAGAEEEWLVLELKREELEGPGLS
jgi:ATP-binding cassette subfamily F protein uup